MFSSSRLNPLNSVSFCDFNPKAIGVNQNADGSVEVTVRAGKNGVSSIKIETKNLNAGVKALTAFDKTGSKLAIARLQRLAKANARAQSAKAGKVVQHGRYPAAPVEAEEEETD